MHIITHTRRMLPRHYTKGVILCAGLCKQSSRTSSWFNPQIAFLLRCAMMAHWWHGALLLVEAATMRFKIILSNWNQHHNTYPWREDPVESAGLKWKSQGTRGDQCFDGYCWPPARTTISDIQPYDIDNLSHWHPNDICFQPGCIDMSGSLTTSNKIGDCHWRDGKKEEQDKMQPTI